MLRVFLLHINLVLLGILIVILLNLETGNLVCCLFAAILCFCPPMFLLFPDEMAIFIQLLRRRMTKTSKMLPPVAAVLPAKKGNETLVKWGLLPCCRFSGPLSIHLAFLAFLCCFGSLRLCVEVGKSAISVPPARLIVVSPSLTTCCDNLTIKNGEYFRLFPALQNERQNPRRILSHTRLSKNRHFPVDGHCRMGYNACILFGARVMPRAFSQ